MEDRRTYVIEDKKIYVITDGWRFGFSFGVGAAGGAFAVIFATGLLSKAVDFVLSLF